MLEKAKRKEFLKKQQRITSSILGKNSADLHFISKSLRPRLLRCASKAYSSDSSFLSSSSSLTKEGIAGRVGAAREDEAASEEAAPVKEG